MTYKPFLQTPETLESPFSHKPHTFLQTLGAGSVICE